MSYHRVLPLPEPLHPDLARRQSQADALLQQTTMANEQSSTANRARSPVSSPRSSSPVADRFPGSPGAGSVDDRVSHGLPEPIPVGSPKDRARTSSQASSGGRRRLPSITRTFQLESPSDICLCQPDPKVPRPRNGTQLHLLSYMSNLQNLFVHIHKTSRSLTDTIQHSSSTANTTKPPSSPKTPASPTPKSPKSSGNNGATPPWK